MSTFAPLQPKSAQPATSTRSHTSILRPSRAVAPSNDTPVAEPEAFTDRQHAPGFSLANIPIDPPAQTSSAAPEIVGRKNKTGLPDKLKAGIERLSGMSLDDVKVHYHSSKPDSVEALAYTQGTDIHVGTGQERHLAHEAWHVVQQKQGRVRPTLQTNGVQVNDDQTLEQEADMMGHNAITRHAISNNQAFPGEGAREPFFLSPAGTVAQAKAALSGSPVIQRNGKKRKKSRSSSRSSNKQQKVQPPQPETTGEQPALPQQSLETNIPLAQQSQPMETEATVLPQPETTGEQPALPQQLPAPQVMASEPLPQQPQSMEILAPLAQQTQPSVAPQQSEKPAKASSLSSGLKDILEKAKKSQAKKSRQKALEDLLKFIQGQNSSDIFTKSSPPIDLKISYLTQNKGGKSNIAVTQYKSSGKGKATITIYAYKNLFDLSPEAIYSTIYHEFIHAAQRTAETDDPTESTDPYMYEPQDPTKVDKQFIPPLQEIETHVWEIEHADETGMVGDKDYYTETWTELFRYTKALTKIIAKKNVKPRLLFWKGYIQKAIVLLDQLIHSSVERIKQDPNQVELVTLRGDLQKAYGTIS